MKKLRWFRELVSLGCMPYLVYPGARTSLPSTYMAGVVAARSFSLEFLPIYDESRSLTRKEGQPEVEGRINSGTKKLDVRNFLGHWRI